MLAISLSAREVRYINWDRQGEEVSLIACQLIPWDKEVDPFHDVARFRDIIHSIVHEVDEDMANPVYLALDAGFCHFSVLEIDAAWNAKEQLDFIQSSRHGNEPLYASFQYPLDNGSGLYLNIDCPMLLRQAIESVLPSGVTSAHTMNIGIFSAFSYAKRVVPALDRGRRLFWRVSEGGLDQFLEIQEGAFRALHFYERNNTVVRHSATIGDSNLQEAIIAFLRQLNEGKDASFPEVENVFAYLGSGGTDFLERTILVQQSTLAILNPFWRWNWPEVPEADNRFTQSAFSELADAVWMAENV